jgi:hypothetical protein
MLEWRDIMYRCRVCLTAHTSLAAQYVCEELPVPSHKFVVGQVLLFNPPEICKKSMQVVVVGLNYLLKDGQHIATYVVRATTRCFGFSCQKIAVEETQLSLVAV